MNRIFRYIQTEGGLSTVEIETVIANLNRQYIKNLLQAELNKEPNRSKYAL